MGGQVREVMGQVDWNNALREAGGKLVVADFSATWCGPCKFIKPLYEQMSTEFTDVLFLYVNESNNSDLVMQLGIRGFPTFHFYINGQKVDELVGANASNLRTKIDTLRLQTFNPFLGSGNVAGSSSGSAFPTLDPREARLRRFGDAVPQSSLTTAPVPTQRPLSAASLQAQEDEDLALALALSQQDGGTTIQDMKQASDSSMQVDTDLLSQLQDMGFPEIRCRKALLATNSAGLEGCIAWLEKHQDDVDIDEPIQIIDLSNSAKAPLTEEEKAAKIADLKKKAQERRKARELEEQSQSKLSEIERRKMGQETGKSREEIEAIQRQIAYDKQKKEKEESKRERERLRAEIEKDKAERLSRGGKVSSGAGIIPAIKNEASKKDTESKRILSPEEYIVESVEKLKQYRVGNDGLTALKTLRLYVENLIEKPDELKYLQINLNNTAFKKRVSGLVGGISFLKALGYVKNEADNTLNLAPEDKNAELLALGRKTLDEAIAFLS